MNNFISDFFIYLFGFAAVEGLAFGNTNTFYIQKCRYRTS